MLHRTINSQSYSDTEKENYLTEYFNNIIQELKHIDMSKRHTSGRLQISDLFQHNHQGHTVFNDAIQQGMGDFFIQRLKDLRTTRCLSIGTWFHLITCPDKYKLTPIRLALQKLDLPLIESIIDGFVFYVYIKSPTTFSQQYNIILHELKLLFSNESIGHDLKHLILNMIFFRTSTMMNNNLGKFLSDIDSFTRKYKSNHHTHDDKPISRPIKQADIIKSLHDGDFRAFARREMLPRLSQMDAKEQHQFIDLLVTPDNNHKTCLHYAIECSADDAVHFLTLLRSEMQHHFTKAQWNRLFLQISSGNFILDLAMARGNSRLVSNVLRLGYIPCILDTRNTQIFLHAMSQVFYACQSSKDKQMIKVVAVICQKDLSHHPDPRINQFINDVTDLYYDQYQARHPQTISTHSFLHQNDEKHDITKLLNKLNNQYNKEIETQILGLFDTTDDKLVAQRYSAFQQWLTETNGNNICSLSNTIFERITKQTNLTESTRNTV